MNLFIKKLFLFSTVALLTIFSSNVSAQMIDELELEPLQENQQDEGIELTKKELKGVLSTACNIVSTHSQRAIARNIAKEVNTSLSESRLEELAETAREINELSGQEKTALCQS